MRTSAKTANKLDWSFGLQVVLFLLYMTALHWVCSRLVLLILYGYTTTISQNLRLIIPPRGSGGPYRVSNGDELSPSQQLIFPSLFFALFAASVFLFHKFKSGRKNRRFTSQTGHH